MFPRCTAWVPAGPAPCIGQEVAARRARSAQVATCVYLRALSDGNRHRRCTCQIYSYHWRWRCSQKTRLTWTRRGCRTGLSTPSACSRLAPQPRRRASRKGWRPYKGRHRTLVQQSMKMATANLALGSGSRRGASIATLVCGAISALLGRSKTEGQPRPPNSAPCGGEGPFDESSTSRRSLKDRCPSRWRVLSRFGWGKLAGASLDLASPEILHFRTKLYSVRFPL